MIGASHVRPALQWCLGLLLIAAAAGKLFDLPGFAAVLESYRTLPAAASMPAALAMSFLELGLGAWLLIGRRLPEAAAACALLHAAYAIWSAAALARGLRLPNCGCFGVFLARPLTGWTVVEDLALTALSLVLRRQAIAARSGA